MGFKTRVADPNSAIRIWPRRQVKIRIWPRRQVKIRIWPRRQVKIRIWPRRQVKIRILNPGIAAPVTCQGSLCAYNSNYCSSRHQDLSLTDSGRTKGCCTASVLSTFHFLYSTLKLHPVVSSLYSKCLQATHTWKFLTILNFLLRMPLSEHFEIWVLKSPIS